MALHYTSIVFLFQSDNSAEWSSFFGRFHPVLVHLPIGFILIGLLLEFLSRRSKTSGLQPAVSIVLFWGAISAIFSCLAGYFLKDEGGYDEDTLFWHQWLGISIAILTSLAYIAKKFAAINWLAFLGKSIMPLSIILPVLITVTGHLGGNLTHGADYLTANTPEPIRGWLGIENKKEKEIIAHKITDSTKALAYADIVQPILENKCFQCHNSSKQKGGLRMDTPDFLKKGGKNGPIFLASNALSSEMIKRAMLPENDDKHMPPKGKTQLTDEEVDLMHWWIQSGASFDKKVLEIPKTDKVKPVLALLLSGAVAGATTKIIESAVYSKKLNAADESDIKKLTDLNVLVMPLAKDLNLLQVSCVNNKDFDDNKAGLLTSLSSQIVWLKLTSTKITDTGLANVSKLENLVKLHLEHTKITDVGIDKIQNLSNLEYLNLFDTQVTDASLPKLAKFKSLKKVYLWQSKCTKAGIEAFRKANPSINVDFGWEGTIIKPDSIKAEIKESKNV